MLRKRIMTSLVWLPFAIAAIWFGAPWFTLLVALFALLAIWEFYHLVSRAKAPTLTRFGLIYTLLFIASPHLSFGDFSTNQTMLLTSAVMISLIILLVRPQKETAFASWVWSLGGIIYLGLLLSYLVALRGMEAGREWVFFAICVNASSDAIAYFIGRAWGRRRLAPNISPGKTWEGAVGGIFGAILGGTLLFNILEMPVSFSYVQAVLLSIIISVAGQLGDLVESLFKRNMEVKESGNLMPGHGGFLDRVDSVVFVSVVVYYYVIWLS